MLRFLFTLAAFVPLLSHAQEIPIPSPPQLGAKSYFLMDSTTGQVIAESRPDEQVEPASLTKLMTAYVAFKALEDGRISLDDDAYISEKAWRTEGSRTFVEVDTRVSVQDLLRGSIIQSGNDASVALAEHIAGTEDAFVDLMNQYAAILGMTHTSYRNSTGLPAEGHYSSARDSAILARATIEEFPEYYRMYAEREFTYNDIRQSNRNTLLWRDQSVDGLKTGHTDSAGYCLVSSAVREGMRLIAVVMGMASEQARADGSLSLLSYGFRFYETRKVYTRGEQVTEARVWKGDPDTVGLGVAEDVWITAPRGYFESLSEDLTIANEILAPVEEGADYGELAVALQGETRARASLVALSAVPEAGFWTRVVDAVSLWFE
jgi:D-alanyl-D-alanine carboxypeptidase (penicillin-binding protein 5/6)